MKIKQTKADQIFIEEVIELFRTKVYALVDKHPILAEEEFIGLFDGDKEKEHDLNVNCKLRTFITLLQPTPLDEMDADNDS